MFVCFGFSFYYFQGPCSATVIACGVVYLRRFLLSVFLNSFSLAYPSPPYFLFSKVLGVQAQLAPRAHWTKQAVEDQSQQLSAATPSSWSD